MKRFIVGFLFPALTIFYGCSSGDGGGGESASQLISDGWNAYAARSYRTAAGKFNQALSMDGTLVDAYNGAGWSYAKLDRLDTASTKFNAGIGRQPTNKEINAGLAFVTNATKLYQSSITHAQNVIQLDPAWTFSRDNAVDWRDLQVLLAENYFALAHYDSSLIHVRLLPLGSGFTADTTTVQGRTALADEIESLRLAYGN